MIDLAKDVYSWWMTGVMGLLLYWLPVLLCTLGYTVRCVQDYRKDLRERYDRYYNPRLRIGTIIGRAVVTVIPVANLIAAVFSVFPALFGDLIEWLAKVFEKPLVAPCPRD